MTTRMTAAKETRPLVENGNSHRTSEYQCLSGSRDKQQREKFPKENRMILSTVPYHLQVLTRVREMLIARAIPIIRVYIKHDGQKKKEVTPVTALICPSMGAWAQEIFSNTA